MVDSAFRNYLVTDTGSGTFSTNRSCRINFTPTPYMPIIATNGARSYLLQVLTDANGNYYCADIAGDSGGVFNYFVASLASATSADTYGLRVFDSNAKLVFDSGLRYFKIVDVIQVNVPNSIGGSATYTHAYAANPYYALNSINGVIWGDSVTQQSGWPVYHPKVRNVDTTHAAIEVSGTGTNPGTNVADSIVPNPQYLFVCSL